MPLGPNPPRSVWIGWHSDGAVCVVFSFFYRRDVDARIEFSEVQRPRERGRALCVL
jgi:hypothetical protein